MKLTISSIAKTMLVATMIWGQSMVCAQKASADLPEIILNPEDIVTAPNDTPVHTLEDTLRQNQGLEDIRILEILEGTTQPEVEATIQVNVMVRRFEGDALQVGVSCPVNIEIKDRETFARLNSTRDFTSSELGFVQTSITVYSTNGDFKPLRIYVTVGESIQFQDVNLPYRFTGSRSVNFDFLK
jgi:hypothetical protein